MAQVVLEGLSKAFGGPAGRSIRALEALSLTIEAGELLTLAGPSGCGKTTALRLIAGLEVPDAGTISIDGQIVNTLAPQDREVAMVFQNHALYPHLNARENLAFGLMLRRRPKAEIAQRVGEVVELLGLGDCLDRRPSELSGGQRQRVALGRALVRRPKVLLLDEPLSDLDAPKRAQMRAELARLHRQLAATWIYVTHDQTEALTLGNRLAVLQQGALQQIDTPLNLYQRPRNVFVAGFIGSPAMNFFPGKLAPLNGALCFQERADAGSSASNLLGLRLPPPMAEPLAPFAGTSVLLGLRPEHFRLATTPLAQGEAVQATVETIEQLGAETVLHLSRGATRFAARLRLTTGLQERQTVALCFDWEQAQFFHAETQARLGP